MCHLYLRQIKECAESFMFFAFEQTNFYTLMKQFFFVVEVEKRILFHKNKTLSEKVGREINWKTIWANYDGTHCTKAWRENHKLWCYVFIFSIQKHHHKRKYFPPIPLCFITQSKLRKLKHVTSRWGLRHAKTFLTMIERIHFDDEKWRRWEKLLIFNYDGIFSWQ